MLSLALKQIKGHEQKKCFYCSSTITKKNGLVNGTQLYKCASCGRQFLGGDRINNQSLWKEYTEGKQTYSQLATKNNRSIKTIQRRLDKVKLDIPELTKIEIIALMDTTYFGRNFGVMLFRDAHTKTNLYKCYVKHETNQAYVDGILHLQSKGFIIKGIVCDGRKGLLQHFKNIPIQMCQFHQVAIITRYLTRKPKLEAAKELRVLALLLTKTDKESFVGALQDWYSKWQFFLDERTTNKETGKSFYTHKRLRSAHRSFKTNLPWLFTWYENISIKIPNTTNAIDGHFADLKNKLRNHNGLSIKRKKKFIDEFLKA